MNPHGVQPVQEGVKQSSFGRETDLGRLDEKTSVGVLREIEIDTG